MGFVNTVPGRNPIKYLLDLAPDLYVIKENNPISLFPVVWYIDSTVSPGLNASIV